MAATAVPRQGPHTRRQIEAEVALAAPQTTLVASPRQQAHVEAAPITPAEQAGVSTESHSAHDRARAAIAVDDGGRSRGDE